MPLGISKLNTLSRLSVPTRTANTCTAGGNAKISTAQSKIGSSSALFDGTTDYLTANGLSNIGTGDFTIELWARHSVVNTNQMYLDVRPTNTNGAYPGLFFLGSTSKPYYYFNTNTRITANNALAANTWYHIAIVRSGGVTKMYIGGTAQTQTYTDSSNITNSLITIGAAQYDTTRVQSVNGYIDEFRISNIARYTANFTPSTTAFSNDDNTLLLLHFEGTNGSTTFTDDNS